MTGTVHCYVIRVCEYVSVSMLCYRGIVVTRGARFCGSVAARKRNVVTEETSKGIVPLVQFLPVAVWMNVEGELKGELFH